jgi:hypothetical protein
VPFGASGSSIIRANDFVFGGISEILISGLISEPVHVYFDGIASLLAKSGLVIIKGCFRTAVIARKMRD